MSALNKLLSENGIYKKSGDTQTEALNKPFFEDIDKIHSNENQSNGSCNSGCSMYEDEESSTENSLSL